MDGPAADERVIHAKDYNADTWDDSVILNVFDEAIRKHRRKNDQLNGGSVRDSRSVAVEEKACGNSENKSKRIRFSDSQDPVSEEPVAQKSSFSSMLSSYASSKQEHKKQHNNQQDSSNKDNQACNSSNANIHINPPPSGVFESPTGLVDETTPPSASVQQLFSSPQEQALTDMLMSWYQSGYATGRYQALLEVSQQQQQQHQHVAEQQPTDEQQTTKTTCTDVEK